MAFCHMRLAHGTRYPWPFTLADESDSLTSLPGSHELAWASWQQPAASGGASPARAAQARRTGTSACTPPRMGTRQSPRIAAAARGAMGAAAAPPPAEDLEVWSGQQALQLPAALRSVGRALSASLAPASHALSGAAAGRGGGGGQSNDDDGDEQEVQSGRQQRRRRRQRCGGASGSRGGAGTAGLQPQDRRNCSGTAASPAGQSQEQQQPLQARYRTRAAARAGAA